MSKNGGLHRMLAIIVLLPIEKIKFDYIDSLDLMVTRVLFFPPFLPPLLSSTLPFPCFLECYPALRCNCMSLAGDGVASHGFSADINAILDNSTPCCHGFPYCYTLLYVCLYDFPSESSHGARRYARHCVCSNNVCHKRPLRCNSHSQSGLLIYSFVS